MQKKYKIFTKKLANILCKKGFILLGVEVNNTKPWLYVYLFEDTDELRTFVAEYIGGKYE